MRATNEGVDFSRIMTKVIKYITGIVGVLLLIVGIFLGLFAISWNNTFGECGMAVGPIYGDLIKINKQDQVVEQKIEIPLGAFGLANLSDSLSPKLIKFDNSGNVIWAVEFREDPLFIPHQKLSKMELRNGENGVSLSFFNNSYDEPGTIYLTEDYELKYMCLSPM